VARVGSFVGVGAHVDSESDRRPASHLTEGALESVLDGTRAVPVDRVSPQFAQTLDSLPTHLATKGGSNFFLGFCFVQQDGVWSREKM